MTDKQAVEARVSRRVYSGEIDKNALSKLKNDLGRANLESGLEMRFVEDGDAVFTGLQHAHGVFSGVRNLFVLAGPPQLPHLKELCGYYGERLVLEATKLGLGTCWVGGTYDHAKMQTSLPTGQELVAVITVGPVKNRKGVVERAVGRAIGKKRKEPRELAKLEGAAPEWFMKWLQAAVLAPSAMNRQPVRFVMENGVAAAGVPTDDGFNLVDLGIAKLHFEIGAGGHFERGNGASFVKSGESE